MLLDTHIFLWWLFNDPKLPEGMLKRIKDSNNIVFVSVASVWEITTKYSYERNQRLDSHSTNPIVIFRGFPY